MRRYYGKYRAIVLNNIDVQYLGRIQVQVPALSGYNDSTWAMPCLPFCGIQSGFYVVPAEHSAVWIEFEQGDIRNPIWVGCFWDQGQLPSLALAGPPGVQQVVMQTTLGNTLLVSDVPGPTGGILLQSSTGAFLSITDTGIIIDNGQGANVTMTGPSVSVNEGAMEVI